MTRDATSAPTTTASTGAPPFREAPAVSGGEMVWTLIATVFVLLLATAGLAWLRRSGWRPRWAKQALGLPADAAIEVLERRALTPQTRLILVRVRGQEHLVIESTLRAELSPLAAMPAAPKEAPR